MVQTELQVVEEEQVDSRASEQVSNIVGAEVAWAAVDMLVQHSVVVIGPLLVCQILFVVEGRAVWDAAANCQSRFSLRAMNKPVRPSPALQTRVLCLLVALVDGRSGHAVLLVR